MQGKNTNNHNFISSRVSLDVDNHTDNNEKSKYS